MNERRLVSYSSGCGGAAACTVTAGSDEAAAAVAVRSTSDRVTVTAKEHAENGASITANDAVAKYGSGVVR